MREIDEALRGRCGLPLRRNQHRRDAARMLRLPALERSSHPGRGRGRGGKRMFGGARAARELPGFGAGVETSIRGRPGTTLVRVSELDSVLRVPAARRSRGDVLPVHRRGRRVRPSVACTLRWMSGSRGAVVFADGGAGYLGHRVRRRLGGAGTRLRAGRTCGPGAGRKRPNWPARPDRRHASRDRRLGPKGLYALERLLDHAHSLGPATPHWTSMSSSRPS